MNRKIFPLVLMAIMLTVGLTGCEVVGDLVEFGVWIGVIIVVAILAIIFWIYRKLKR